MGGIWVKNCLLHNTEAPAITVRKKHYHGDVIVETELWFKNGVLHRKGGKPALEHYLIHKDGTRELIAYAYFKSGILHRKGKPACYAKSVETTVVDLKFKINTSKKFIVQAWFYKGSQHRDGEMPSYYTLTENGKDVDYDKSHCYTVNGRYHNVYGPALVDVNFHRGLSFNGRIIVLDKQHSRLEEYYIDGRKYSKEDFENDEERCKFVTSSTLFVD